MSPELHDLAESLDRLAEDDDDEVRVFVRRAVALIEVDPAMSMIFVRKALDHILRDNFERSTGKPSEARSLRDLIQSVLEGEHFPRELGDQASKIRELADLGVYRSSQPPETVSASVFEMLLPILRWHIAHKSSADSAPTIASRSKRLPLAAPSKQSVLLDRRLITEMAMLLSRRGAPPLENPYLSFLLSYGLTIYSEFLLETTYSSALRPLIERRSEELGDGFLFVRAQHAGLSEDFSFALADAAEDWAEDSKFQLAVSRYDRRKGGGVGEASEAIEYVQHVLLRSHAFDAAIIPHPERWPIFKYVIENCLWAKSSEVSYSETRLPDDPLDGSLSLSKRLKDRAAILPSYFGEPTPCPMSLVRYDSMGYPFPPSLLRHYTKDDLAEFGTFSYEFLLPMPEADSRPTADVSINAPVVDSVDVKPATSTSQQASPHKKFDVFISHNSKDKSQILRLGEALKKCGLTVWLDEWELVPGHTWQDALESIITTCNSAVVCVGDNGIGPWEEPEMQALLRRFVNEKKSGNVIPIIPVLLPGAPSDIKLPLFLEAFTWVDLRNGLRKEGLTRLQWGITGIKPT